MKPSRPHEDASLSEHDRRINAMLATIDERTMRSLVVPPRVCMREAKELVGALERDGGLRGPVEDLGVDAGWMALVRRCIERAEESQQSWLDSCQNEAYAPWAELEERAMRLRARMIAMGRYYLRAHEESMREIDEIQKGEGVSDLILDLDALARLFRAKARHFQSDQSVELGELIEAAKELSRQLRQMMFDLPRRVSQVRQRRDEVFFVLDSLLELARAAGRYRFWDDEESRAYFLSAYRGAR